MEEVRRPDDGELCGHVEPRDGSWRALVVFGALLGVYDSRQDAVEQVLTEGLAALSERWMLHGDAQDGDQIVCIQEANAHEVTLALDYYAMPGVPTLTISRAELDDGTWTLTR